MITWQQPARSFTSRAVTLFGLLQPSNRIMLAIDRHGLPEAPGTPLEEARHLLGVAAAVEHALMVQYLYCAYSMDEDFLEALQGDASALSAVGLAAVQEMGHLIAAQNLLLVLGAEPTLGRQDQVMSEDEYPFPFLLEPFSRQSLAKYLLAESPTVDPADLPPEVLAFIKHALKKLDLDGDGLPDIVTRPVGLIYAKLYWLLQEDDRPAEWADVARAFSALPAYRGRHIREDELAAVGGARQTVLWEWGSYAETRGLTLDAEPVLDRAGARRLLHAIARQGEGYDDNDESHFRAFVEIQSFLENWQQPMARPWPVSPTVNQNGAGTRIRNPASAAVAVVANAVYDVLLHLIAAGLSLPRGTPAQPGVRGGLFKDHAYELMRLIARLAARAGSLPLADQAAPERAAPTFELAGPVGSAPGQAVVALRTSIDSGLSAIGEAETNVNPGDRQIVGRARAALERLKVVIAQA